MKILKNQTLYQCSYCGKRLLSKSGALLHEDIYCKNEEAPTHKGKLKKQENCEHKHFETIYTYIPGEAVQEPDHDECYDCGLVGSFSR